MEHRFGAAGVTSFGIFFSEAPIPERRRLEPVSVEISRQNANLSEVKDALATAAKTQGANAIAEFKYGQRAHPWWELFAFKWATESWYGSGNAVRCAEPGDLLEREPKSRRK